MRIKERESKDSRYKRRRGRPGQPSNRRVPQVSALDPDLFVKKAVTASETAYIPSRSIEELPIDPRLVTSLLRKGYSHPTEIQDKTLESILRGQDLMGIAQTGTGKTGAFLVPLVNNMLETLPCYQILVIVPTRELAVQVEEEFKSLTGDLKLFSACFIGGTSVVRDIQRLRRPYHLIIGTPGRLLDLANQGALNFRQFTKLVLDEFDRLLDMGFARDIQRIIQSMTNRKQTILFSATEERSQRPMISRMLNQPVEVRVSPGDVAGDRIDQEVIVVGDGENKLQLLFEMVQQESFQKVLVFADTKRWVKNLCRKLQQAGVSADEIHGNKSQNYRLKALSDFKSGKTRVLIATDVAARGLDISEVTHVINYHKPKNFDSYIHRIGRTGRAGKTGKAYTFVN